MSKNICAKLPSKNQYYERDHNSLNKKRLNYKSCKYKKHKGHNKYWSSVVRAQFFDDDIDIGNIAEPGTIGNVRKGDRSRSPKPSTIKKKLWKGSVDWYRITMPFGNKYDKKFLEETLMKKVDPLPFWPIAWETSGDIVTFYVDDYNIAEKLQALSGEFKMPDGFKISIKAHHGSPNIDITDQMKEQIKLAMANRYNPINKALDLSKFHSDPILKDYFCGLCKPTVLLAVIDLIEDNIPELQALNLNNNKIQKLSFLKEYVYKLKNVKILYLGENKINDVTTLDSLIEMPLVELLLENNTLCDKFEDKSIYISEMQGRFPKLLKLDGMDLPPPICFDLEEQALPCSIQTFLCNTEGEPIVRRFLEEYFLLFDSDNRLLLTQAYHENAVFSMTMAYPYGAKDKHENCLHWYATDNRNIMRVTNADRRFKLLKRGNASIVLFLEDMPRTKHDIMNFKVDLTVCSAIMMSVVVSGMFKELRSSNKPLPIRSFLRTLVITPAGQGYCIANEELHITNATESQIKTFMSTPLVSPIEEGSSASVLSILPDFSEVSTVCNIDDATKHQMVEALADHSGMNIQWSMKCLQEIDWNFNRAIMVFNEAKNQGGIPQEAFVK